MTDYTKNTNFTAKDSLISGNPAKIIKGSELDAEFDEIATAIASKEDSANKGAANGYAPLNASSELADSYLTSNVPLLDAVTNTFTGSLIAAVGAFSTTLELGGAGVWTSGNDGAGSGLDADLLDGQQGAYYLAASSYTAADVLSKLLTVDGTGSGVDADLLDGAEGSAFAKLATNANFTATLSYGGIEVGYRVIPALSGSGGTASTSWRGKHYASTGGITLPAATFTAGDSFVIYNNSASPITITRGASLTMYYYSTDSATVSLAAHDTLFVLYTAANVCVVK